MVAPEVRKTEIHGVHITQTRLQGKWYTPVDSRVKIAEQADPANIRRAGAGYNVSQVAIIQVGDRWAYTCMVEYPVGSGVWKPGSDFIDIKDMAGLAKAETSAIGRGLGLHGIAIEESIASLDEMRRADPQSEDDSEQKDQSTQTAKATPVSVPGKPASTAQNDPIAFASNIILKYKIDADPIKAMRVRYGCDTNDAESDARFAALLATDQGLAELLCSNFFTKKGILHNAVTAYMQREKMGGDWATLAKAIKDGRGTTIIEDIKQH